MVKDTLFLEWLEKIFLMVFKDKGDSELFESSQMTQNQVYGAVTTEEVVNNYDHQDNKQGNQLKEVWTNIQFYLTLS